MEVRGLQQKRDAAKVQTLGQYSETIFMPIKSVTISENGRCAYQGKAHATCVNVYTILHSLFTMAYMTDVVSINPMDKVGRPKPRKGEIKDKDVEAYTTEEVQRIFDALEHEPLKWRALMRLLIDTGIRWDECCGLQKYNVPELHPQKLRHTFISIAISNGADVASVSEKLGHSDKAVTLRMYTHADQESMNWASQIFRDTLKKLVGCNANQYLKIYRYGFLYGFPAGSLSFQAKAKTRYPLQDNGFLWSCYPDLNWGLHPYQVIGNLGSTAVQHFRGIFVADVHVLWHFRVH